MHYQKYKNKIIAFIFIIVSLFCCNCIAGSKGVGDLMPKYVFYFIGDGMAIPQVHATEVYLSSLKDEARVTDSINVKKLNMSKFPHFGTQMSYSSNRFITGSAAAGTALASGMKTNVGVISMDPDATIPYKTLAEAAREKGMKVAIISSVSIDHATPAVFYAHTSSRINYEEIGESLLNSNFDFFGGGGFLVTWYRGPEYTGKTSKERHDLLEKKSCIKRFYLCKYSY